MIMRALVTLLIIFAAYRLYLRLFKECRCIACARWISSEAAICHHCNTVQNGIELVQADTDGRTTATREGMTRGRRLLLSGAIALLCLALGTTVWIAWYMP